MARRSTDRRVRTALDSVFLHDMKNLGFRLSLLLSNLQEHYGDPEFKLSALDLLQSTVARVDSVVQRWIAHKDTLLIKVTLDVNEVIGDVRFEARPRERGGSIPADARGRIEFDPAPLPRVWGDPFYLKNAFLTVLQNGLEASGPRGVVRVRTSAARLGRRAAALVEIDDEGPGIPADFRKNRLFRPFQTTKPEGVGLGLYTAKEIVQHHGGRITAHEGPRGGALFRIVLPAEREELE